MPDSSSFLHTVSGFIEVSGMLDGLSSPPNGNNALVWASCNGRHGHSSWNDEKCRCFVVEQCWWALHTITRRSYEAFTNKNPGADWDFLLLYILYERLRDEYFFLLFDGYHDCSLNGARRKHKEREGEMHNNELMMKILFLCLVLSFGWWWDVMKWCVVDSLKVEGDNDDTLVISRIQSMKCRVTKACACVLGVCPVERILGDM
jgi:hypothetical protein